MCIAKHSFSIKFWMHSLNKVYFIMLLFHVMCFKNPKYRSWPQGLNFMWSCEVICPLTQIILMGHVTGQKSKSKWKEDKSNLNSYSNYISHFCPFLLIQNPFGIWSFDKKQSWSLFYKDQLWYSKFFKFTYKIWSNFEMIQMLKCTPNSNFKMEAEFENIPWSKVVEFEKLSNFHFWRFSTSLEKLWVICKINAVAIL